METNHRQFAALFLLSGLAACGGGGGGGSGSPVVAPSNLTYADDEVLELSGVTFAPLAPTFDGDVDTFEVTPALPAGLALDPRTGVVDGIPTAPSFGRDYTITARNAGGSVATALRIEIAAPQRFALVTNSTDASLATLAVDSDGARFLRGPLSFAGASDAGAEGSVAHPNGRFLYTTFANTNTLAVRRFDGTTGSTQPITTVPLDAGPHAATFDRTGNWLLVTCRAADVVRVYAVDALTGALTLANVTPLGKQPSDLGFSPDGERLFVTHAGVETTGLGSSLAAYEFQGGSGTLRLLGAPLGLNGGRPTALTVDPDGAHVYLTLGMFDAVLAVRVTATSVLAPIPPLHDAGAEPIDVEVDARGRFVYVAAAGEDEIRSFRVHPTTNALQSAAAYAAGLEPRVLRRDALGNQIYALAYGSEELLSFGIEDDGDLVRENSLALRAGASHLTFVTGAAPLAFAPRFVHVANQDSDDVHAFRADAVTGALTFTGQAFTDDAPTALAVDASSQFALVVATGARTVQRFAISATNGALTPSGPSLLVPGNPFHVAIEPSGRYAYVATRDVLTVGDGAILTFRLSASVDDLTLIDQRAAGSTSCAVAIEPTAQYVYVANAGNGTPGSATISTFRLDPVSGIPSAVGSPVSAPGIAGLAFHPDGRSVYGVLRGADALARYSIDTATGALSVIPPATGTGFEPSSIAVDPRGRFVWAAYMGNAAAGQIDVLPVLGDSSLGAAIQQIVDGNDPMSLGIENSGRFLYAANRSSNDISVLAVGAEDGLLEARTPALAGTTPVAIVATGTMQ